MPVVAQSFDTTFSDSQLPIEFLGNRNHVRQLKNFMELLHVGIFRDLVQLKPELLMKENKAGYIPVRLAASYNRNDIAAIGLQSPQSGVTRPARRGSKESVDIAGFMALNAIDMARELGQCPNDLLEKFKEIEKKKESCLQDLNKKQELADAVAPVQPSDVIFWLEGPGQKFRVNEDFLLFAIPNGNSSNCGGPFQA